MEGGCTCGAVRYRLAAEPMFVHCCHCSWCQRQTGSAFALNALIETAAIEVPEGAPVATTLPSPSGRGQTVHRCPSCGVTLWSHYAGAGDRIAFVRVGTLDDPAAVSPDIHIFTATKQPWVALPDGVPAVPEFYRYSDHWPAASYTRFTSARAS